MTKVAIIGAGPCGLSMLRSFEQAQKKGEKIPERLKAMTIKSNLSFNKPLENFLNLNFFGRLIFKAEWYLFFDERFLINTLLYGSVIVTLFLFSRHGIEKAEPMAPPPIIKIFFI